MRTGKYKGIALVIIYVVFFGCKGNSDPKDECCRHIKNNILMSDTLYTEDIKIKLGSTINQLSKVVDISILEDNTPKSDSSFFKCPGYREFSLIQNDKETLGIRYDISQEFIYCDSALTNYQLEYSLHAYNSKMITTFLSRYNKSSWINKIISSKTFTSANSFNLLNTSEVNVGIHSNIISYINGDSGISVIMSYEFKSR